MVPYQESSAILRFLTRDAGVLAVMGKGVRKGGRGRGFPGLFSSGSLQVNHRPARELQTLRSFEVASAHLALGRSVVRLAAASVLAELVLQSAGEDTGPEVYEELERTLSLLEISEDARVPAVLLAGGWASLARKGFGPSLDRCGDCGAPIPDDALLRFSIPAGGVVCRDCLEVHTGPRVGPTARAQLSAFVSGEAVTVEEGEIAHLRLLQAFSEFHLSPSRKLRSFTFLFDLLA